MKLTKKKAIAITIELWAWLAETGDENKEDWPSWKKYGEMDCDCPLCEYSKQWSGNRLSCRYCPYKEQFYGCLKPENPFKRWCDAKTARTRKKYATLFLEQLRQL